VLYNRKEKKKKRMAVSLEMCPISITSLFFLGSLFPADIYKDVEAEMLARACQGNNCNISPGI
jgi:hypothetical protein